MDEEFDVARQFLQRAYEAARAVDYRPDSPEMQRLARAEERYQQARLRRLSVHPRPGARAG